jgi:hypothetical protein
MSNGDINESGFGNKGKRTSRVDENAVIVDSKKKEYLDFKLTVKGAKAIFTFACMHKPYKKESDFSGFPAIDEFEWMWGKNAGEFHHKAEGQKKDKYGVRMSFVPAVKYTLVVKHCDENGGTIEVLKDVDYESQDPHDTFVEFFTVF